jgi:hypothetical protein
MSQLLIAREPKVIHALLKCERAEPFGNNVNLWTWFEAKAVATVQASGSIGL